MTIGKARTGHKKIFQKVSPKKDLLQHFNINRVIGGVGMVSATENRTDTVSKPVTDAWNFLIINLIISQLQIWH